MQLRQRVGKPRSTTICSRTTHCERNPLFRYNLKCIFHCDQEEHRRPKRSLYLLMDNLFLACTTDLEYTVRLSPLVQNWYEGVPGLLDRLGYKAFLLFCLDSIGMQ